MEKLCLLFVLLFLSLSRAFTCMKHSFTGLHLDTTKTKMRNGTRRRCPFLSASDLRYINKLTEKNKRTHTHTWHEWWHLCWPFPSFVSCTLIRDSALDCLSYVVEGCHMVMSSPILIGPFFPSIIHRQMTCYWSHTNHSLVCPPQSHTVVSLLLTQAIPWLYGLPMQEPFPISF